MPPRAPGSIGINPTIAVYSLVLGGACAFAAYTEKYRRDQDDIDSNLKERYYSNMKEQQAKTPMITQTIRGQDIKLDGNMDHWVWGGKAKLPGPVALAGDRGGNRAARMAATGTSGGGENGDGNTNKNLNGTSDGSVTEDSEVESTTNKSTNTDDVDESQLSNKERRRRRKERRRKRKQEEEEKRQKLVIQSVAAGATVGAIAVAASVLLNTSTRK